MSLEVIRKIWVKMSGFNPRPSVFPRTLYLRSYIEKFLQVFFLHLLMFKLNLKIYVSRSILGPSTNQKWLKYTFQWYIVCFFVKQHKAAILRKLIAKENFDEKFWITSNTWQVVVLQQY